MRSRHRVEPALALGIVFLLCMESRGQTYVQFDFDDSLDPTTEAGTIFGLVSPPSIEFDPVYSFESETINGEDADVLAFERGTYFRVMMGFGPNGGGVYVNQYTIIMDVNFPDRFDDGFGPTTGFTCLFNTNVSIPPANDGEAFINPQGGIGLGTYGGMVADGEWHRLALVFDNSGGTASFYVDGELAHTISGLQLDGTPTLWSTNDGDLEGLALFADDTSENAAGLINSLQIWDTVLPASQIAAIGGPTAAGIPTPEDLGARECFNRAFAATSDLTVPKVTLTWTGAFGDEGFEVLRGGTVISGRLAATARSFVDTSPPPGGVDIPYVLRTFFEGQADHECSVTVDTFTCLGAVTCCVNEAGEVDLAWTPALNLGHTGHDVLRDGTVIATLGARDVAYRDTAAPTGVHVYGIRVSPFQDPACPVAAMTCRAVVAPRTPSVPECGGDVAQWELAGDLASSTGQAALEPIGYPDVPEAPSVAFVADEIDGEPAMVASITQGTAFVARHDLAPNGGGIYLNDYTLILDVKFPVVDKWISLLQTNDVLDLSGGNDGDWFVDPNNTLGANGSFGGVIEADEWYRLALAVSNSTGTLKSYIDGFEVQELAGLALDDRWSLYTRRDATPYIILFGDETPGAEEMGPLLLASVQLRDYTMSAEEIEELGGATASGIPLAPPAGGGGGFHRGDPNADGTINITDGISVFNFLFLGGSDPVCLESADADNSGTVNITDGIVILNFLFQGGSDPAAPGPTTLPCGPDPDAPGSPGDLGCASYPPCAG